MASPAGLQLYFDKRLPDEVLQRIFEFGFHIWLAKPHDITTQMGEVVKHLVSFEDVKPDVCFDGHAFDDVSDRWVEKRMEWAEYYVGEYMYEVEIHQENIIGLALPRVRQEMLDFEIRPRGNGFARRITNQRGRRYWLYQCEAGYLTDYVQVHIGFGWHFNPIHLVPPTHGSHDIDNPANMLNAVIHMMRQAQYESDSGDSDGWEYHDSP
jgi:hypothetical protein